MNVRQLFSAAFYTADTLLVGRQSRGIFIARIHAHSIAGNAIVIGSGLSR
jgi:hypothetical protein